MILSTHPDQSPRGAGLAGRGNEHAGQHAHRPLSDDVLQSAQDAVGSEGVQSPYTGRVTSRLDQGDALGGAEVSAVSRLTRYVRSEPAKAAVMAAGAGALLAMLMGRRKGGRR